MSKNTHETVPVCLKVFAQLVRIENDTALRDAFKNGVPFEQSQQYYPQRHIVQLSSAHVALIPQIANVGSLTLP